eukprot:12053883-Karenia_brevis.AAC.1
MCIRDRFKEVSEEGLRLSWEEARAYKEEHGLVGDLRVTVDRAKEEYVTDIGYTQSTDDLSKSYAEWSATATVALASRGNNTLSEIIQKDGVWAKGSI